MDLLKIPTDLDSYYKATKFGAAVEVIETLMEEGFSREDAEDIIQKDLNKTPDVYNNPEDFKMATHKEHGYLIRLNQTLNGIREMIQEDVIQVLKSGHKPHILALRDSFVEYIKIIDGMDADQESSPEVN